LKDVVTDAEERLLVDAAKRDRGRFAELYEMHFERVYAFIGRRVQNRAEAQDLTSEVFRKALEGIERFEWRGVPFAAWLYRIATNAISDQRRKSSRETGSPDLDDKPAPKMASIDTIENRAALYRLVRDLPADQRRVIEMRFADEKGIREIAQAMGRTEGAVKQLQFRAIQNLRERMGERNA
jgi:RNA polymerase sigma-70 factor (ECF subfamily)